TESGVPRIVNYVWANTDEREIWPNPFSTDTMMIAVTSGGTEVGRWRTERVNVASDFKRAFGVEIAEINAIAIMADSDNSEQQATAWFGEIFFSK
ncbi:MAG: DUF3047 domain-containing protein, partial [Pseudomonadales bacterium]